MPVKAAAAVDFTFRVAAAAAAAGGVHKLLLSASSKLSPIFYSYGQ